MQQAAPFWKHFVSLLLAWKFLSIEKPLVQRTKKQYTGQFVLKCVFTRMNSYARSMSCEYSATSINPSITKYRIAHAIEKNFEYILTSF